MIHQFAEYLSTQSGVGIGKFVVTADEVRRRETQRTYAILKEIAGVNRIYPQPTRVDSTIQVLVVSAEETAHQANELAYTLYSVQGGYDFDLPVLADSPPNYASERIRVLCLMASQQPHYLGYVDNRHHYVYQYDIYYHNKLDFIA